MNALVQAINTASQHLLRNWDEISSLIVGTGLVIAIAFGLLSLATEPRAKQPAKPRKKV